MNYVFLDLEFNQPLVAKGFNMPVNKECPFEIIEIGAVKVNKYMEEIGTFKSYVRNMAYERLNPKIARLTKIRTKYIIRANTFRQVMWKFNSWLSNEDEPYLIFTWGNDDIAILKQNFYYSKIFKENTLFIDNIIDLQNNLCKIYKYKFKKQNISLKHMLEYYKINMDKRQHRALVDARYESKIFITAFRRLGLKNCVKLLE